MANTKAFIIALLVLAICLQGALSVNTTTKLHNSKRGPKHGGHHPPGEGHHEDGGNLKRKKKRYGLGVNPIDECWMKKNWTLNRKQLADCVIGFGSNALGGRDGDYYVVTDPSDDNVGNPSPGTLRHGVMQREALWIYFAIDMTIGLKAPLTITSYKTVDGRGTTIKIGNGSPCLELYHVEHVILESLFLEGCGATNNANYQSGDESDEPGVHGDAIHIEASSDVWVDHNTLSNAVDGLVDVSHGSTRVTISNNYLHDHDKVMLLGHDDMNDEDKNMRVTVAYNTFGPNLVERMPRCRLGQFHIFNNDYQRWKMYAIGGSGNPTILSEGNRFAASSSKTVTKRMSYSNSSWRSKNDVFENGAWFEESGPSIFGILTSVEAGVAQKFAPTLTKNSGPLTRS